MARMQAGIQERAPLVLQAQGILGILLILQVTEVAPEYIFSIADGRIKISDKERMKITNSTHNYYRAIANTAKRR